MSDLLHGLQHYRDGRSGEALWWWQFSYLSNWGSTASSVLRALHSVVSHTRLDVVEDETIVIEDHLLAQTVAEVVVQRLRWARGVLLLTARHCFGLCCVVPAFSRQRGLRDRQGPGSCPAPISRRTFAARIHPRLRQQGFAGCTVYDCFGAGQQVSQVTFGGQDWRRAPETAEQMYEVFPIVRALHELLWYLTEALTLPAAAAIHGELRLALEETERLAGKTPDALLGLDVAAHRDKVNALLIRTSDLVRAAVRGGRTTGEPT